MKTLIALTSIFLLLIMTSSCSPKADTEKKIVAVKSEEKSTGILSDAQTKALEKAKETETLLKETEEKRLKTLNEAQ